MNTEKTIVVVGAGLMGTGIAHAFAATGHTVTLVDTQAQALARARQTIEKILADGVRLGAGAREAWDLPAGTRFSLLPMGGEVRGVTTEGAAFPLLNETLGAFGPTAISNVVTLSPLLLSVGSGSLLALIDREPEPSRSERGPE